MRPQPSGPAWRHLLTACLPWTGEAPRRRRAFGPLAAPFITIYLVAIWVIFVPGAERVPGNYRANLDRVDGFLFRIPDLSQNLPRLLRSLVVAPWLNHNAVQLVYVTFLLLLVGVVFEVKEGSWLTIFVFFWTSFVGAMCAAILLHLIYPEFADNAFFAEAWQETWSGGSAGCFGLMGAMAARTRIPWPLLAVVLVWEINVVYWYLREYTPVFHLTALAAGFVTVRYLAPFARRRWPRFPVGGRGLRLDA
jgi:hypothetical protein